MWTRLQSQPRQAALAARSLLTLLCLLLASTTQHVRVSAALLLAALLCAFLGARTRQGTPAHLVCVGTEACLVAFAIVGTGGVVSPVLPYVIGLALSAGLVWGVVSVMPVVAGLVATLALGRVTMSSNQGELGAYLSDSLLWATLCSLVGLLGALSRRMLRLTGRPAERAYLEANQLIRNLRSVARALPATLEPIAQAENLLDRLFAVVPFQRAGVFVRLHSGSLSPLAVRGGAADWDLSLRTAVVDEAWVTQNVQVSGWGLPRRDGRPGPRDARAMIVPLEVGLRSFGIVALEVDGRGRWTAEQTAAAAAVAAGAALPLETALLFDEVRELAVSEERHRLAREIHDGIAQELAQLGYALDDAAEEAGSVVGAQAAVLAVRADVSRIVSELRHSLFDLRSDVDRQGGLSVSLTNYVRDFGAQTGLTVHLSLKDGPARLAVDTEAQLLRIAQEAMVNARKHARARNLWVTCRIAPPSAALSIEDDGTGFVPGQGRPDGHGLEIMRERARRIQGRLEVSPAPRGGTLVQVSVGVTPDSKEDVGALDRAAG